MLKRILGKICFNLLWIPVQLLLRLFFRFKIESEENLKEIKLPLLITVNHASWLDPILACAAFPFNSKVYPICFAAWYRYYYSPLFLFMLVWGAFPVRQGIGLENVLKEPVKILKNGGVVGIFPEGRRRHFGRPRKGKRGAAYLALNTGVPILPIKITGTLGIRPKDVFSRRKIVVKTGKMFYLAPEMKYPEDLNKATDLILAKLRAV